MDKKISKTLTKVLKGTQTASSPSSSTEIENLVKTLGDPNCPHCGGVDAASALRCLHCSRDLRPART
jgi:hypothetical protein